jgi:hypothetical protein
MIKVIYKESNPYCCQGVRLTPGNNVIQGKNVKDFMNHPGVISRINLNIIEVLSSNSEVNEYLENCTHEVKVVSEGNIVNPQVEDEVKDDGFDLVQLVIDKHPVKQTVEMVKQSSSIKVLEKVVELTDSVRIKKAAEERVEELLKT